MLGYLTEEHPTATVREIRDMINFDPELGAALDTALFDDGHGEVTASVLFQ